MWIKAKELDANTEYYLKLEKDIRLPNVDRSSGAAIDMWIKAKELDANTEYYLELEKDIRRPKYFQAQEAIDYGIADKIIGSRDAAFEKLNYDEMLAQSKATRSRTAGNHRLLPLDLGNQKEDTTKP